MVEQNVVEASQLEAIQGVEKLNEYEKRLKRAARFGLDTAMVIGPSVEQPNLENLDMGVTA
jgi:hypothetical protein